MNSQRTLNGREARTRIELDEKLKQTIASVPNGWRARGYEGASKVTKRLLRFWFLEEHLDAQGRPFSFWHAQKEAIEALIYLYEVAKYHNLVDLIRGFDLKEMGAIASESWPKYAFKMATGSGKTYVMELAVVWQYFNKIFGTDNGVRYSNHFLILAPNLIVFDRLRESFEDAREMRKLPFVPPEWSNDFDLQVILQSERVQRSARGTLTLTNIQQLYEREEELLNPVDAYIGPKPKDESDPIANWEYLYTSLTSNDDLFVINDEAHHVHSDDREWNRTIKRLNDCLVSRYGQGLVAQLDFSATPKDLKGNLFSHIIYDYPLRQAIIDRKVKRPKIGILERVPPPPKTNDFALQNKAQIDTGIENLLEYKKILQASGKKPVLFIMTDSTRHADRVGRYLEQEKGFKNRVLIIHTDSSGNITKTDLPRLREAAREIDTNQYEIIVSVMMLKEGWDVRNVVIIVPLRAFKSELLPEQTLGRGLRLMDPHNNLWDEWLTVIDHPRFRELWNAEIRKGELEVDLVAVDKARPQIRNIFVDPNKTEFDFEIPILEGGIVRRAPQIMELKTSSLPSKVFRLSDFLLPKIMYREKDLLTSKIIREKELAFDYTDNFDIYLGYITNAVAKKAKMPTLFTVLLPLIEEYLVNYLFEEKIDPNDSDTVKKLNDSRIREKIVEIFVSELTKLSIREEPAYVTRYYKLSNTQVLHTTKSDDMLHHPAKSVFNLLPADSQFEMDFMSYLDKKSDVQAYTKVFREGIPLHILYIDEAGYSHYYTPDFIVKTEQVFYLVETKGEEYGKLPTVKYKDKAAGKWCRTISEVTGKPWYFVKIMYKDFKVNTGLLFEDLVRVVGYTQVTLDE